MTLLESNYQNHPLFSKDAFTLSWKILRIPFAIWIAITSIVLSVYPRGWHTLIRTCGTYFDAGNYTRLALFGYEMDGMTAFYPLWPIILRILSLGSDDPIVVGVVGSICASFCFALTLHILIHWLVKNRWTRHLQLGVALLVLSPLSLFRVLSFTESLFSLLSFLLIYELTSERSTLKVIALWTALLALSRPMFPILMVASILIAVVLRLISHDPSSRSTINKKLLTVFCVAPLGYVPFGIFCQKTFGNFWQPFAAQANWGRSFGFHWDILFSPKVINGSNEVLVWDLLAFYGPFLLLAILIIHLFKYRTSVLSLEITAGVLLAILIACAHAALAFLTLDRFMSLSRHVLSNPLLYASLNVLTSISPASKEPWIKKFYLFMITGSTVFLGMWWARFLHDRWIG